MDRRRFLVGLGAFAGAIAVPAVMPKAIFDMGRGLALPTPILLEQGYWSGMSFVMPTLAEYGQFVKVSDLISPRDWAELQRQFDIELAGVRAMERTMNWVTYLALESEHPDGIDLALTAVPPIHLPDGMRFTPQTSSLQPRYAEFGQLRAASGIKSG